MQVNLEGNRITTEMTDADAMRLVAGITEALAKRAEQKAQGCPVSIGYTLATGCPVVKKAGGKAVPGVFAISIGG